MILNILHTKGPNEIGLRYIEAITRLKKQAPDQTGYAMIYKPNKMPIKCPRTTIRQTLIWHNGRRSLIGSSTHNIDNGMLRKLHQNNLRHHTQSQDTLNLAKETQKSIQGPTETRLMQENYPMIQTHLPELAQG